MAFRLHNFTMALAAALAALAFGVVLPAYGDVGAEHHPAAELEELGAAAAGIKVSAWVDRPDATYRPGDTITLMVKASRDAYITVLDAGTSGKVHVVFPNRYQSDNRVQAFEVVRIPGEGSRIRLAVHGPAGREVLKIFASEKPIDYLDVRRLAEAGAYYTVPGDAQTIARDLSVELNERDRAGYGVATQVVTIVTDSGPGAIPGDKN
jgi:hypothetical protein